MVAIELGLTGGEESMMLKSDKGGRENLLKRAIIVDVGPRLF